MNNEWTSVIYHLLAQKEQIKFYNQSHPAFCAYGTVSAAVLQASTLLRHVTLLPVEYEYRSTTRTLLSLLLLVATGNGTVGKCWPRTILLRRTMYYSTILL